MAQAVRPEYPEGMVQSRHRRDLQHGANVAVFLGWPKDQVGLIGAFGGLLDIGAQPRRPRSMTWLVRRHRIEGQHAVYAQMRRTIRELSAPRQ